MKILFTLLSLHPYIEFPQGLAAWLGWLLLLGVNLLLARRWRGQNRPLGKRELTILGILFALTPITSLFIGVRMSPGGALPPPGIPEEPYGPAVMIGSAIPWMVAGGLLGPWASAGLALLTGILQALFDHHNPFTPLELSLMALVFSQLINQRYRTRLFRLLSLPLASSAVLCLLYPAIFLTSSLFYTHGALASRLDYTLSHLAGAWIAMLVQLIIGGATAQMVALTVPSLWNGRGSLIPSPAEKSLQARFLARMAPLAILLILTLMIGDWYLAGQAARDLLHGQMQNISQTAAETLPYFLDAGQNLIQKLAMDARLRSATADQLPILLAEDMRTVPYFQQFYLLDHLGNPLSGYPLNNYKDFPQPQSEQAGIQLALNGVPVQSYTIQNPTGDGVLVSFIAAVQDDAGGTAGVLIGRSDLASNPLTLPILKSLDSLTANGGKGLILDQDGRILYHPDPDLIMTPYSGQIPSGSAFFDDTAPDGTRSLVFYQPVIGRPWAMVLTLPATRAQTLALQIAAPMLVMIVIVSLLAVVMISLSLRSVNASLRKLAAETELIAQGQLDHPLAVEGEDEVGKLRRAFDQMRIKLKARLDELNRLLAVSQGVASSLEIEEAVHPILEAAQATGARIARIVLTPGALPGMEDEHTQPVVFDLQHGDEALADLDDQILALLRGQNRLVVPELSQSRQINTPTEITGIGSLVALAVRHENTYYGAFWVAYEEARIPSEEELRFLVALTGQAALAATNNRLFLNAEVGRQRLAAILASSPDAVLVTDRQGKLILANPAAWQVLGFSFDTGPGRPLEEVIKQKELAALLRSHTRQTQSIEITLPGNQVFLATASPVIAEGQPVGRVCVLRDVTRFKELEKMKSEFVATVSHDLRSPLTVISGAAKMLEVVGPLSEQQTTYVRSIVNSVDGMTHLVSNILDLSRIEAGIGLKVEMVPVREVIEQVLQTLQIHASQKRIELGMEILPETPALIEADPALLHQALQNLVENAIKYTRTVGKVTLRARPQQDRIVFEVNDTGIGISPVDQMHVFDKFFRGAQLTSGSTTAREPRGTGLGLAIVKSIAERHGGQAWVESQLGKGSTFFIAVPLRQPGARDARL